MVPQQAPEGENMQTLKKFICEKIIGVLGEISPSAAELETYFEYPPNPEMGDLALACFKLSKTMRKAPAVIAIGLAEALQGKTDGYFDDMQAVSGYLNFFIADSYRVNVVLTSILNHGDEYGRGHEGDGKTMCIDFSSPNIAKPFHIGHLGTTAIGHSLRRIYAFSGYHCVGINHLGDWGTQFGRLIVAYKGWGSKEDVELGGVAELSRIYKEFYIKAEEDPSLHDQAKAWFTAMENGNREALELWNWFKEISLSEFKKTYDLLGIEFESWAGESFYNDQMQAVVDELTEKRLLEKSDGAMLVNLEEDGMPPCLILKNDGSTLYATRDIAAAIYRYHTYGFDTSLYVTDAGQSLHFAQFFKVIEKMGYPWASRLRHVPYGKISVGGQKLATRTGNVVLLSELFDDAIKRVYAIIDAKNPQLANKDEVARKVGVGAVIFNQLSTGRIKDVNFVWEDALNFDGNTGPYVQYTYARSCSVLAKAGERLSSSLSWSLSREEKELLNLLVLFPQKVEQAKNECEPSVITRYILDICACYNRFYHNCPILKAEGDTKELRLRLCEAFKAIAGRALWLIGLEKTEAV